MSSFGIKLFLAGLKNIDLKVIVTGGRLPLVWSRNARDRLR